MTGINSVSCWPPLDERDVRATARSLWRYKEEGRLFLLHGIASAVISRTEFARLADDLDAIVLLILLRLERGGREEPFAIAPVAMSKARILADWSQKHYRQAREGLSERGFIDLIYKGGAGRSNPHLFQLRKVSPVGTQYNTISFSPELGVELGAELERCASFIQVRYGADGSTLTTAGEAIETSMLFTAASLPIMPTPTEQLRRAYGRLLSSAPRGTHTRFAAALGISRQQLSNWRAKRYPINAGAEAQLSAIINYADGCQVSATLGTQANRVNGAAPCRAPCPRQEDRRAIA